MSALNCGTKVALFLKVLSIAVELQQASTYHNEMSCNPGGCLLN